MTQREINQRKPFDPYNRYGDFTEFEKGDLKQIIGLVLGFASIFFLLYLYKTWAIRDFKETTAVFIEDGRNQSHFKFTSHEGNEIEAYADVHNKLDLGDTIWIKYSTFDNDIIEVIDKDYKKHLRK